MLLWSIALGQMRTEQRDLVLFVRRRNFASSEPPVVNDLLECQIVFLSVLPFAATRVYLTERKYLYLLTAFGIEESSVLQWDVESPRCGRLHLLLEMQC